MKINGVWYASESRLHGRSKWIVYDDTGDLTLTPDSLVFSGRETTLSLNDLAEPQLVHQSIAWTAFLLMNAVVALPLLIIAALVARLLLDLDAVPLLASLLIACNLLGFLVARSTRWVQFSGTSASGESVRCFFADGSRGGWGGILGGTRALYESARRLTRRCS